MWRILINWIVGPNNFWNTMNIRTKSSPAEKINRDVLWNTSKQNHEYKMCTDCKAMVICQVARPSLSSSSQHLHILHLQHKMHGAARRRNGEATSNSTPNPANIPTTCTEKCSHFYLTQYTRSSKYFRNQQRIMYLEVFSTNNNRDIANIATTWYKNTKLKYY